MPLRPFRLWLIGYLVRIERPLVKADLAAVDHDISRVLDQMRREQLLPTEAMPVLQRLRRQKLELEERLDAYRILGNQDSSPRT